MKRKVEGPHPLDMAIGLRVRERRRQLGLSQHELGAQVGISFQQVQKYERGANRISFSRLVETAAALKCRLADLVEDLEPTGGTQGVEHVNRLMNADGALQMLEAYAALPNDGLRRAMLHHVRTVRAAIDEG